MLDSMGSREEVLVLEESDQTRGRVHPAWHVLGAGLGEAVAGVEVQPQQILVGLQETKRAAC